MNTWLSFSNKVTKKRRAVLNWFINSLFCLENFGVIFPFLPFLIKIYCACCGSTLLKCVQLVQRFLTTENNITIIYIYIYIYNALKRSFPML